MAAPAMKVLKHKLRLIAKWNAEGEAREEYEDQIKHGSR